AMIVLYERCEANLYAIDIELRERLPTLAIVPVAGDVADPDMLEYVFTKYDPEVVFHAAAYKHVPLMEANPWQAILNNAAGTQTLVSAALACGVKRFVNISTDKAVNPTSVMGASKRLAEMVVSAAGDHAGPNQAFMSVRFGNVLGSNGSVVPRFKKQIERGGPVTVTHPEMTRYFMTIPEASQLVLQAASLAENGRVYVLDMGEPVKIMDLARDLIMLSGLKLGEDIDIEITGVRPGEKLYEEILTTAEGMSSSTHEKIFVAQKQGIPEDELEAGLQRLFQAARDRDEPAVRRLLDELVPEDHFAHSGDGQPVGGDGSTKPAGLRVQVDEAARDAGGRLSTAPGRRAAPRSPRGMAIPRWSLPPLRRRARGYARRPAPRAPASVRSPSNPPRSTFARGRPAGSCCSSPFPWNCTTREDPLPG